MLSKFLRRVHLYLALFLAPWVVMYAVSTVVMNHRETFRGKREQGKYVTQGAFPKSSEWLERLHRKRGYNHARAADSAWAASVDLFIFAVIAWAISGAWMWWEMKVTRRLGAAFLLAGVGLFAVFLAVL